MASYAGAILLAFRRDFGPLESDNAHRQLLFMATGHNPLGINAYLNTRPAIVQKETAQQKVAKLQERFKKALLNVATSRKEIYEIIVDLKEHFQEYGFKSPAAAVQGVCQRSKTWANDFCAQIEAELEVYGNVVTGSAVGAPDTTDKKEEAALKKVEEARGKKSEEGLSSSQDQKTAENDKPKASQIVVDKQGNKIPDHALQYWNRSGEVQHVLSTLSDLRVKIRKAAECGDRLWCAYSTQTMLIEFDALYQRVTNYIPYAVCVVCKGNDSPGCKGCYGTGLMSKHTRELYEA